MRPCLYSKEFILRKIIINLADLKIEDLKSRQLARMCNMSTEPIYRYFGSLENLKKEIYAVLKQEFKKELSEKNFTSVEELIEALSNHYQNNRYYIQLRDNPIVLYETIQEYLEIIYPEKDKNYLEAVSIQIYGYLINLNRIKTKKIFSIA